MPDTVTTLGDTRFEAVFDRWNLTYDLVSEMALDDIRVVDEAQVRQIANIGRKETVEQYAISMKGGAVFPPIVLMSPDVLIDGNTRASAARRNGRSHIAAYRVEMSDIGMAKMLAATLNAQNGVPLTREEQYAAAINYLDMGWPDAAIARELGCTAESVRRWRKDQEFYNRVERLELTEPAGALKAKQRNEVGKVDHDEPFAELVKLVADVRPDLTDVKELVTDVQQAPSDEAAVAMVAEARQDWTPIGPEPGKRHTPNKKARQLRMHLGGLVNLEPAEVYDPTQAEKMLPTLHEARKRLTAMIKLYEDATEAEAGQAA